jgi:MFS transporter, ACS family, tartrate transporter
MAFRQELRTALAHCGSALCYSSRVAGTHHLTGSTPVTVALSTIVGIFMAFLSSFRAIPTEILSESTAAFAVGMINALASVAGFAGPYTFGYLNTLTGWVFLEGVHSADRVGIG